MLIRTATPAATWSRTSERAASAASAEISSPRFMGPGWQITAWSAISPSRARVSP